MKKFIIVGLLLFFCGCFAKPKIVDNSAITEQLKALQSEQEAIKEIVYSLGKSIYNIEKEQGENKNAFRYYTVKKGDYLYKIAKEVYGNKFWWRKIFNANRDKIQDENLIYPGQTLGIPFG